MRSRDGSFVDKMATIGSLLNLNGLITCDFLEYVYKDVEYDNYVCLLCHQEYANIEDAGSCVLKCLHLNMDLIGYPRARYILLLHANTRAVYIRTRNFVRILNRLTHYTMHI